MRVNGWMVWIIILPPYDSRASASGSDENGHELIVYTMICMIISYDKGSRDWGQVCCL